MGTGYKNKSRNTDFEQHANKIFTAIREINPEYAKKRAIWELFQNALDVTSEKGIITICDTPRGFKFEHNGRPFSDGNLTGLIKQSSNGKTYGSNENEAGQYGTGFLSTHVYGKIIIINGSVETDNGIIKSLTDFYIDRDAESPWLLNLKIQDQDGLAETICDGPGHILDQHSATTSFEYLSVNPAKQFIEDMFDYIPDILPYIFVFNDKLEEVRIIRNGSESLYQRGKSEHNKSTIFIDSLAYTFDYLSDPDLNLKVIISDENRCLEKIPKFFLYYPLMDTEDTGVNFLTHAREFRPNRERDFLHLIASNDEITKDVATNKLLIDRAFELVLNEVKNNEAVHFLSLLKITFNEYDDEYIARKKENLINEFRGLQRILTANSRMVALESISFINTELLSLPSGILEEVYGLLSQFYDLPLYADYIYLSSLVNNWDMNFNVLDPKQILSAIIEKTQKQYENINNKAAYITFIKATCDNADLLCELEAIPNIYGCFSTITELKKWKVVEEPLIKVMDALDQKVSSTYAHEDFYFLPGIGQYTRENFKDDLNKFNNDLINQLEKNELQFDKKEKGKMFNHLLYFISLNKVTETNKRYAEFFHTNGQQDSIESPTVELNYDSSFKLVARLYIKSVQAKSTEYLIAGLDKLECFIKILYDNGELRKNLLDKLACFPSQSFVLKPQNELKIDDIRDERFKDYCKIITGIVLRDELLIPQFSNYISHDNSLGGIEIGNKIELAISSDKRFIPIEPENEAKLTTLLEIVEFLAQPDSSWVNWLPNINAVKEEILMHKFQDESTRQSLFSILSVKPEKINLLGELSKIHDLEGLIRAGNQKQKEEARVANHMAYIAKIGLNIQSIIEQEINISLKDTFELIESIKDQRLETAEEQNGQDFIIYKTGYPVYYIEVKSRWDEDGIVALSKRQVERCANNPGVYAVITVNVADYKNRHNTVSEDIAFEELEKDIYVNSDLSDNFEKLIEKNLYYESISENTKLIEFRGHIPQKRIRLGNNFTQFIEDLKSYLLGL